MYACFVWSLLAQKLILIYCIFCAVLFCATNGQFSTPIHLLLTDYIDASGGSADLICLLNRLGIVSSLDSLNRHICAVALQRKANGVLRTSIAKHLQLLVQTI